MFLVMKNNIKVSVLSANMWVPPPFLGMARRNLDRICDSRINDNIVWPIGASQGER